MQHLQRRGNLPRGRYIRRRQAGQRNNKRDLVVPLPPRLLLSAGCQATHPLSPRNLQPRRVRLGAFPILHSVLAGLFQQFGRSDGLLPVRGAGVAAPHGPGFLQVRRIGQGLSAERPAVPVRRRGQDRYKQGRRLRSVSS